MSRPSTDAPAGLEEIEAWDRDWRHGPLVFLDLEMTGTDVERDRICELAAIRVEGDRVDTLVTRVQPGVPVGASAQVHGLSDADLADAPPLPAIADSVRTLLDRAVIVGHRVAFDLAFLSAAAARGEIASVPATAICTRKLAQRAWHRSSYSLAALCAELDLTRPTHRAYEDACACRALYGVLGEVLRAPTVRSLWQASQLGKPVMLRDDCASVLREAVRANRLARIAYRVPGRPPFEDELEVQTVTESHVEGRLRARGVERVLRGDRLLWAELGAPVHDV